MSETAKPKPARRRLLGDLLTTAGAAALLRVSQQTVIKQCDLGAIPHHRVPGAGRHRRIRLRDLREYAARNGIPLLDAEAGPCPATS